MKCGQIVLVNYPFTDNSGSKVRPALLVSADRFNHGDDLVVVPISSVVDAADPYSYTLAADDTFFRDTGLRQTSSVRWTKPLTISRRVLRRRLGQLARGPLQEIQARMRDLLQS